MKSGYMKKSITDEWETPKSFVEELEKEFGKFTLDPCATKETKKAEFYYDNTTDGLDNRWFGKVFVNPPYSQLKRWIEKASQESKNCDLIVMLIPARTDTKAFHEYIYNKPNVECRFLKGRIKFVGAKSNAPFPSMLVIFIASKGIIEKGNMIC